jgi:hypothetical protein
MAVLDFCLRKYSSFSVLPELRPLGPVPSLITDPAIYRIIPAHIRRRAYIWKYREHNNNNKESQKRNISEQS